MTLSPLSDTAIVLAFGETVDDAMLGRVRAVAAAIHEHALPGVVDVVPAFAQVTVFYDIVRTNGYDQLCAELRTIAGRGVQDEFAEFEARTVEIPVCYGGELGPDLETVASHAGISAEQVVGLHSAADYRVHAIGFAPGFAYLGGLPQEIQTPRHATPRLTVPAGAVAIGGNQAGVYPLATPGGWNIIGRTPLRLFDPERAESALLRTGDQVNFRGISQDEFHRTENAARSPSVFGAPTRQGESAANPNRPNTNRNGANVEVLKAGMLTTVQDRGRHGMRASGVPLSGGADALALRLANMLVGNAEDCAVLECTLIGPELRFAHDAVIALSGAEFDALPRWQPIRIVAGTVLKLGRARAGCRGYLAIAGGVDVAAVLGSKSTYTRAALGGVEGRALRDGDVLRVPEVTRRLAGHWHVDERILPAYSASPTVRVVRGGQADEVVTKFLATSFKVTAQSDRMGVRLSGPEIARTTSGDLVSSAVVPGTVQMPPDGQPIVLMSDAQTLGGYPQVAHVISVDLPLVAQLRPGDQVRFREVSLAEAHKFSLAQEHALGILQAGIAQKFI